MDFTFNEEQQLLHEAMHDFLCNEVNTQAIRQLWKTDTGRSNSTWKKLAKLGWCGFAVPKHYGGMGLNELDFILPAQECGYVALPEPLVQNVMVVTPLLVALNNHKAIQCLKSLAAGEMKVSVGLEQELFVEDAHIADVLILQNGKQIHLVHTENVSLILNESIDLSRKLYTVEWEPSYSTLVADGEKAAQLIAETFNRGALACAALSLGLVQRMMDLSVQYTSEREQFGHPVGSFQAVKHHLANVAVQWEFAKAPVYRAAYAIANQQQQSALYVSQAKIAACDAAQLAAKNAIQVHGAMGYTWEMDLHIFMKKAWALNNVWGDRGFHMSQVANWLFSEKAKLHSSDTFEQ